MLFCVHLKRKLRGRVEDTSVLCCLCERILTHASGGWCTWWTLSVLCWCMRFYGLHSLWRNGMWNLCAECVFVSVVSPMAIVVHSGCLLGGTEAGFVMVFALDVRFGR